MKKRLISIFLVLLVITACNSNYEKNSTKPIKKDLLEIKEDGVLKVLVTYSSTSYFLYRGQPLGFEYELLERMAKQLDLKLDIVITKNIDNQFDLLNSGEVDLIAHGITITGDRKEEVDFTDYLYLVKQVLVQKQPDNWRKMSWANLQKQM